MGERERGYQRDNRERNRGGSTMFVKASFFALGGCWGFVVFVGGVPIPVPICFWGNEPKKFHMREIK